MSIPSDIWIADGNTLFILLGARLTLVLRLEVKLSFHLSRLLLIFLPILSTIVPLMIRSTNLNAALIVTNVQTVVELLVFHAVVLWVALSWEATYIQLVVRLVKLVIFSLTTSRCEFTLDFDRACTVEKDVCRSRCLRTMSKWNSRAYIDDFTSSMLSWTLSWLVCSNGTLTTLSSSSEFDLLGLPFSVLVISNFATRISSVLWWLIRNKIWTNVVHIDTANSSSSHDWHCTILLVNSNHLCTIFFVSNACSILDRVLLLPKGIHYLTSTSRTFMSLRHLLLYEISHVFTWLSTSISVIIDILWMGSISRFFRNDCWARSSWLRRSLLL